MAFRSYAGIATQIGVEATAGTSVPANRQLMGFVIDPKPSMESQEIKPSGLKLPTGYVQTSEKTEASWDSALDYESIVYPLSSIFGAATITPNDVGSPTNYEWAWTYTAKGSVAPKTYSVERGDAAGVLKFNHAAFTSADMSFQKNGENKMSGNMIGRAMAHGGSLTASPVARNPVPVIGKHLDVYADADSADLGDTKMLELFSANLNIGDVLGEVYTINSDFTSFTTLVNSSSPSFDWQVELGADAVSEAFFSNARSGTPVFMRLIANGGPNHRIEIDMCVGVKDVDSYKQTQEVYALGVNFGLLYNATWGKAMEIRVTNTLAAL